MDLIILLIKSTAVQEATEYCRGIYKTGAKDAYRKAKAEKLTAFAVSGWCEGPLAHSPEEGRFHHNGRLQIDADGKDHPGVPFAELMALVRSSPHVKYAFRSPSGDGVKAIIRIPASCDLHNPCFDTALRHFASLGLKMDTTTRNINRLCYIPFDPDIWVNPNEVVELEPVIPDEPWYRLPASPGGVGSTKPPPNQIQEMLARIPPELGYADWLRLSNSVLVAAPDQETAIALLEEWWPADSPGRYHQLFRNPLRKIGIGTLYFYARRYGWTPVDEIRPFPTECLPGVAREMACEIARVTSSRSDRFAGASVLGVLSAAIGGGIEYRWIGEMMVSANTFILVIGESGTGKSSSMSIALEPLLEIEREQVERFQREVMPGLLAQLQESEAKAKGLIKRLASADPDQSEGLRQDLLAAQQLVTDLKQRLQAEPCIVVNNATQEAIQQVIGSQPHEALASITAEARGVFSIVKGKYSRQGGDESLYTSAYSREPIKINRIGRGSINLAHPCLSVTWMVQPDTFRDAVDDPALSESGFLPRFLAFDAMAEAQPLEDATPPIPDATKGTWAGLISRLVETFRMKAGKPFEVLLEEGARLVLREYEQDNIRRRGHAGDLRDMVSFAARWGENACRIALILHCAEHGEEAGLKSLNAATAENAVRLMRWFADEQMALFSSHRNKKQARRLEDLTALLNAVGEMTLRDLSRSHGFKAEEVTGLATRFPQRIRIETRSQSTGGRPSRVAIIIPT